MPVSDDECLAAMDQRGDSGATVRGGHEGSMAVLNAGAEDEFQCVGYRQNTCKAIAAHLVSLLLLGVPYLIAYWRPEWRLLSTKTRYCYKKYLGK